MRYLVIAYDKSSVTVNRLEKNEAPWINRQNEDMGRLRVQDVLCQGSSFGDVVKALESAFAEEQASS